ncbi:MAG TPA: hypothetical protein VJA47_00550 [archaeon]|nr:hypothetical protein [archaeon]
MAKNSDKVSVSKTKLLLMVVLVLVIVIVSLFVVLFSGPSVSSWEQADKLSKEVLNNIDDIKSSLNDIKTGLKGG